MSVQAFYDELAPLYHLVYENWEASVAPARKGVGVAHRRTLGGGRAHGARRRSLEEPVIER